MPVVGDPLPYGMKENAASIDAMLNYGLQQGLIPRRMALGEAFVNPD
jgi:4,5-dihydroxyphthalate decarboxylase